MHLRAAFRLWHIYILLQWWLVGMFDWLVMASAAAVTWEMRAEVLYHIFNKFKIMLVLVLEDGDASQQRNQIFDHQQVKEVRHNMHSLPLDSHR